MRRRFVHGLATGVGVVWPILSALLAMMLAMGVAVGVLEGWSLTDAVYFAFVSGLTIGYGDLAPTGLLARLLSVGIGVCGVLFTALMAAIAVKALAAIGDGQGE